MSVKKSDSASLQLPKIPDLDADYQLLIKDLSGSKKISPQEITGRIQDLASRIAILKNDKSIPFMTYNALENLEMNLVGLVGQIKAVGYRQDLERVDVYRGTENQFTRRGNLGRAACACNAGRMLINLLKNPVFNPDQMDLVLDQGIADYQTFIRQYGLANGRYLSWYGEADHIYNVDFNNVGETIYRTLNSDEKGVYLDVLRTLASRIRDRTPIGGVILVGGEFYSIAIHPKRDGGYVVLIYDSHGSEIISGHNRPAFIARAHSLEDAAGLLAARRGFFAGVQGNINHVTLYPLMLTPAAELNGDPARPIEFFDFRQEPQRARVHRAKPLSSIDGMPSLLVHTPSKGLMEELERISEDNSSLISSSLESYVEEASPFWGARLKKARAKAQTHDFENEEDEIRVSLKALMLEMKAHAVLSQGISVDKAQAQDKSSSPLVNQTVEVISLCFRDYIFPEVLKENSENQKVMLSILEEWFQELIPSAMVCFSEKSSEQSAQMSPEIVACVSQITQSFTTFLRDYQQAIEYFKSWETGYVSRYFYHKPTEQEFERQLVHHMISGGQGVKGWTGSTFGGPDVSLIEPDEQLAILERFSDQLLSLYEKEQGPINGLEKEEFNRDVSKILQTFVDLILSPDTIQALAQGFIEDENLLDSVARHKVPSIIDSGPDGQSPPLPLQLQKDLTALIGQMVNLGDPKGVTWLASKLTLIIVGQIQDPMIVTRMMTRFVSVLSSPIVHNRVTATLMRLLSHLSPKSEPSTSLDLPALMIDRFKQYNWVKKREKGSEVESLARREVVDQTEMTQALYKKMLSLAKEAAPYHMDKLITLSEYVLPSLHSFSKTFIDNVFQLSQRPLVMKLFFYKYLMEGVLIPEVTRRVQESERQSQAEIEVEPKDLESTPYLAGRECGEVLGYFLQDYVAGNYLNQDSKLMRSLITFSRNMIARVLPSMIEQSLKGGASQSLDEQEMCVSLYGSIGQFFLDYSESLQQAKREEGVEKLSPEKRSQEVLRIMNQRRQQAGMTALKVHDHEVEERLKGLSDIIVAHSTRELSPNQKNLAYAIAQVTPRVLREMFDLLACPEMMNQFLGAAFQMSSEFAHVPPDKAEDIPGRWDEQHIARWNHTLLQLIKGIAYLGEPEDAENTIRMLMGLAEKGHEQFGSTLAQYAPGPSALFAPSAWLMTFKAIKDLLWDFDEAGHRVPKIKDVFSSDPREQEKLRQELTQKVRQVIFSKLMGAIPLSSVLSMFSVTGKIESFCQNIGENLFTLIQSQELMRALIYNYVLEDLYLPLIKKFEATQEPSKTPLLLELPVDSVLDIRQDRWSVPEERLELLTAPFHHPFSPSQEPKEQIAHFLSQLENATQLLRPLHTSPKITLLYSILHRLEGKRIMNPEMIRRLLSFIHSEEEFSRELVRMIGQLEHSKFLTPNETKRLALLATEEGSLVLRYLDLISNCLQKDREVLEQSLALFLQDRRNHPEFLSQLGKLTLIKSFGGWLPMALARNHDLEREVMLRLSKMSVLSDPVQIVSEMQEILEGVLKRGHLDETMTLMVEEIIKGITEAKDPLLYLMQTFNILDQVQFWNSMTAQIHSRLNSILQHDPTHLQVLESRIYAFYECLGKQLGNILTSPLSEKMKETLCHQFLSRFQSLSKAQLPRKGVSVSQDSSAIVCRDSSEANQYKLELIRHAKKSVVMSGCYCGGRIFDQALDIILEKLQEDPHFDVKILASEFMLTSSNWERIKDLKRAFPDRFLGIITPEVRSYTSAKTGRYGLSSNHVKALIIDDGKYFLMGGSGMEDRWAYQDGTHDLAPPLGSILPPMEPSAFRDTDFVFHCPHANSIGRLIQLELLQLMSRLVHPYETHSYSMRFDRRFNPMPSLIPSETSIRSVDEHPSRVENTKVAFYSSGPDDHENQFLGELINMVNSATHTIYISHMYFHPSQELLQALIDASNRGVNIIIITNRSGEDMPGSHKLFAELSKSNWKRLFQGHPKPNVEIYEYDAAQTTYHKKIVVVDGEKVATGSSNCGLKSLEGLLDEEYNVIVDSEEFAVMTINGLYDDMLLSRRVPDEEAYVLHLKELLISTAQSPLRYFL
jgi:phosphatidylserine/phosphatidylglycerophosphate/cardiolipin synthase-like enzyme